MLLCISLLLLALGMWSLPRLYPDWQFCEQMAVSVAQPDTGTIDDRLADRVAIIKAQHDLSDAIITYRSTGTNSFEACRILRLAGYCSSRCTAATGGSHRAPTQCRHRPYEGVAIKPTA